MTRLLIQVVVQPMGRGLWVTFYIKESETGIKLSLHKKDLAVSFLYSMS